MISQQSESNDINSHVQTSVHSCLC